MNHDKIKELEGIINREHSNIAGTVVIKNGETVYEKYFNDYTAVHAIHVFSVTKSIVSILIGIAIDKGYIKSIEQNVLDFFPEYSIKRGEKTIHNITIENIITMTAPYKYRSAPYTRYFTSDDWVKSALDLLGGKGPMGEFRYTPLIGPDILSGILVKATGQSVLDFAKEYLFSPLGITVGANVVFRDKEEQLAFLKVKDVSGWVADPKGINTAGWGLTLTAKDMAKIGQLCLDGGKWNGVQIVSAGWIAESTREHSRWKELNLPYGYLWWVELANGYAAMGDSGNVIYISAKNRMVVSIAAFYKPTAKDRLALINDYIEPIFENGV